MSIKTAKALILASVIGVFGAGLSGCVQEHLSSTYGIAVRQDLAAQIADPDARYEGVPTSTGPRVALGQDHYDKGKVTQPPAANASKVGAATDPGAMPQQ